MAEVKWTNEQLEVIQARNCNVLVSAAAGSGKTAVLVERIMSRLTDKEHPINIDQFVIVTFTRAAAAEMRERLAARLDKEVAKNLDNIHLQNQVTLLQGAQISTVHSFCGEIIKNYFHRIGVDPSYTLGSDMEMKMLGNDVMKEMLEAKYEEGDETFLELADTYLFDKSDARLEELIEQIFNAAMSDPFPNQFYHRMDKLLDGCVTKDFENQEVFRDALAMIQILAKDGAKIAEKGLALTNEPKGPVNYSTIFGNEKQMLEDIAAAVDYDSLRVALSQVHYDRLPPKAGPDCEAVLKELAKGYREVYKEVVATMEGLICENKEENHRSLTIMAAKLRTLLQLAREYGERYSQEKKEKGLADFNDLEHQAIEILMEEDEDGNLVRSEAAIEMSQMYEEIMIDEYQDSNYIQDIILRAVSREEEGNPNIFMVGDVKQSIYRFRQAKPELFMEKLSSYQDEGHRAITLSKNFRSRQVILDSTNKVFEKIMHKDLGGVEYDNKAALYLGADYGDTDKAVSDNTELLVVTDTDSGYVLEATMLANRIQKLVDKETGLYIKDKEEYRLATYRDIVILYRGGEPFRQALETVLESKQIPVVSEHKFGFYKTREISLVINILKVLDNPRQDIPLVSVLRSDMFGFTDEELAMIKGDNGKRDYYDYLVQAAAKDSDLGQKTRGVMEMINTLRDMLSYAPVSEVIHKIYDMTHIYDTLLLLPNMARRKANLDLLMTKAIEFDKSCFRGLFQFVRLLENIESNDSEEGEANVLGENENVVRIMTIHKSKGLEYPICFIAGCGKRLGGQSGWLKVNNQYGLASETVDNETRVRKTNFMNEFVKMSNHLDDLGEELRILYVAMTRAKEKLIFTASYNKFDVDSAQDNSELSYLDRMNMSRYLDMIWPAISTDNSGLFVTKTYDPLSLVEEEMKEDVDMKLWQEKLYDFDTSIVYDEEIKETLEFMDHYVYNGDIEEIPVKMSVSDLKKKSMEDTQTPEFHVISEEVGHEVEEYIPTFAREEKDIDVTVNQGAAYGTIWHQVMAFIDFEKVTSEDVIPKLLGELIADGKLKAGEDKVIAPNKLMKFMESDLGVAMTKALAEGKLYREQPFVLGVPAKDVYDTQSEQMVMIQGIIDGFYETEDGIVLMDYKTDRLKPGEENLLTSRYRTQIELYERALLEITGKKVVKKVLYSFSLNKSIEV